MKRVKDLSELAKCVAASIYEGYQSAVNKRNYFSLVLSGGNTPGFIFRELREHYISLIDWSKVHIFWLDERCVLPTDNASNYKLAYDKLLQYCQPASVHRILGELPPEKAARSYEDELDSFFYKHGSAGGRFDFILLGMGDDGHIASLFPNTKELASNRKVVSSADKHAGFQRVSLTIPVINASRRNILLVTSDRKYKVLLNNTMLPVHHLYHDNLEIYLVCEG